MFTGFIIGLIVGTNLGMLTMAAFQINRHEKKRAPKRPPDNSTVVEFRRASRPAP